jgi:hypothetical protein
MTPENLSRAFKGLQPYGVTVEGTRITIGDQADLERFARPNPADRRPFDLMVTAGADPDE